VRKISVSSMRAHGRDESEMPLLRYFLFVGGALLVLLFAAGALLPRPPADEGLVSAANLPAIRIHSERKGPEAVVFDTNRPAVVAPVVTATAEADASPATAAPSQRGIRETLAQFVPPEPRQAGASEPKKAEQRAPRKRKVARARADHPPMRVAQRPHFGLFNIIW